MFRRLLLCLAQICAAWLVFGETTYRDCFEIVPGDLSHIAYSRNKAVDFAALPAGAVVKIQIPNARPGLLYAVGASATLDGLGQAVQNAENVEATSAGVELTVVKPDGGSCFFRMAVERP